MRNIHLYLAIVWLGVGISLIVWRMVDPGQAPVLFKTDWSVGWAGILLALYFLVRWYGVQSAFQQREIIEERIRREREREREQRQKTVEPDPTFDFTNPTPLPPLEPPPEEKRAS